MIGRRERERERERIAKGRKAEDKGIERKEEGKNGYDRERYERKGRRREKIVAKGRENRQRKASKGEKNRYKRKRLRYESGRESLECAGDGERERERLVHALSTAS